MLAVAKHIKRGSEAWFKQRLQGIENTGGQQARVLACQKWEEIVWQDKSEAGYKGADALDKIFNLTSISSQLKDYSAKNRINKILFSNDEEKINKLSTMLNTKHIQEAIRSQSMTEERIIRRAKPYCTNKDPTGHLKARKQLRKQTKQATSILNMTLGLIGKNGNKHCSPFEVSLRNQQKANWQKFGEKTVLVKDNIELSMFDIMKDSSKKKIAEIYTLAQGLESYAKEKGMKWAFLTLTAPPRMHPNPKKGLNSWDGTTPDKANEWIAERYSKVEKRLRKKGIIISGLRVVESHIDGCPHWHILVFALPENMSIIEAEFRHKSNPEWQNDNGFKFMLDNGKAKASSYLFKYVLKTVNQIEKLEGEMASVDAWRSTWAIRAFQWFGMPPVGLWRRLRSIKTMPENQELAEIWLAVNQGNGHDFIKLAGGLGVKKSERPFKSITETTAESDIKTMTFTLIETGEVLTFILKKFKQERKIEENKTIINSKCEKVGVILNYPREAKPEIQKQDEEQNNDFIIQKYSVIKKNSDKPYYFNEEKEKNWKIKDKENIKLKNEDYNADDLIIIKQDIAELFQFSLQASFLQNSERRIFNINHSPVLLQNIFH